MSVASNRYSGSGSGGRIAINYDTLTLPEANITARGTAATEAQTAYHGSAGTIYLKDNASAGGVLVYDNGNVATTRTSSLRSGITAFRAMKFRNYGRVNVVASEIPSFTVEEPVTLSGSATLTLNSGVAMAVTNATGFDLNVESGCTLTLQSGSTLAVNSMRASVGTLSVSNVMEFPDGADFELSSSGRVNVLSGGILSLEYCDTRNIQSGTIDVRAGGLLEVASGSAVIGNTVTLIKDGAVNETDSLSELTINSGGTVTHSLRLEAGLVLNVAGTLDVQSGGLIDLNSKGLRGGNNGSLFGLNGEATTRPARSCRARGMSVRILRVEVTEAPAVTEAARQPMHRMDCWNYRSGWAQAAVR
ncbi:MAG: hypothetical protein IPH09_11700 [bacterium]|nr:hypothetical protein [bacterium]